MTAIFSDYHLFHRLFGIAAPARAEVDALLRKLELEHKTTIIDGVFNTLDLSGGERKRLALLVGLLEKRPVLLLDEWAANQDPHYRRRFYQEILPELNGSGLTIVVVTTATCPVVVLAPDLKIASRPPVVQGPGAP